MAKSRRRSFRSPRTRGDWVYRPQLLDDEGNAIDTGGTYDPRESTLTPGLLNSLAKVLYDSHNYVQASVVGANIPFVMPAPARAEGGNPKILRVQGMVEFRPSAWAIGNAVRLGMRFGIFEQAADGGGFLIPAGYSMYTATSNIMDNPHRWANDGFWQKEIRYTDYLQSGSSNRWSLYFNFKVNRRLQPHQCYGIYVESGGDVTLFLRFWFRTFVVDEAGG